MIDDKRFCCFHQKKNHLLVFMTTKFDKIIYIDTEQSDYHILLILKRIKDVVQEHRIDNLMMFNFDAIAAEENDL